MKIVKFSLFLVLIISIWLLPSVTPVAGISIILFGLAMAISSIFKKHREAYRQGKITRTIFVRNTSLEIFGVLLAMALAGLLGRYFVEIATDQMSGDLTKLIASVIIGLLAGIAAGILVKRAWERFVRL